jgi:hypothetical protein
VPDGLRLPALVDRHLRLAAREIAILIQQADDLIGSTPAAVT